MANAIPAQSGPKAPATPNTPATDQQPDQPAQADAPKPRTVRTNEYGSTIES